jgi:hypothetical protein
MPAVERLGGPIAGFGKFEYRRPDAKNGTGLNPHPKQGVVDNAE